MDEGSSCITSSLHSSSTTSCCTSTPTFPSSTNCLVKVELVEMMEMEAMEVARFY